MDEVEGERDDSSINPVEELKKRKEDLSKKFKEKKNWIIYGFMLLAAWFGYYIRTRNLPLLQGKWLPDVDSYAFLRYAEYIVENGKMMAFDYLRYHPFGFAPKYEFGLLSYTIAYLYKVLHFFNPSATVVDAAILYPPLAFFGAAIFFFLFVKKLFNYKAAIVATAFLAVVPPFLYRTMGGVADKEALAIMFMFALLYFFTAAMKAKKTKEYVYNGVIAGIFTGLAGSIWGGIQLIFMTFGLFMIICTLFHIIKKKQFYAYSIWMFSSIPALYLLYPPKFTLQSIISSFSTQVMLLGFLVPLIFFIMHHEKTRNLKEKIETKMPIGLFSLGATIVLGIIFVTIQSGPDTIKGIIQHIYSQLTHSFASNRWQLTVAENHQPYFQDVIAQFQWKYIFMFMAGAVMLFYNAIKKFNKNSRLYLTVLFTIFLIAFSMSRYSGSAQIFNGTTGLSQLTYIGSLVLFLGFLGYSHFKSFKQNKNLFNTIKNIDSMYILLLVWFIIMIVAARSAIRLMFIFAPVTAVLVGYFAVQAFDMSKLLKKDSYKIVAYIILIFLLSSMFLTFSKGVMAQASYVGPSFNQQWQNGMSWARENTPEDAVFAHWWDYGYWVQWGSRRATISDGGNAYDGINHFVGRHVLTGQSEREALGFLKARNVTHLLIIREEIGKYPAFSSIGADVNYDRYSWISTFVMQPDQVRETRNETLYFFTGGTPLDDDFVYKDKLYPAGSAGVGAFILPMSNVEVPGPNGTTSVMQQIGQPKAVIVYNGIQEEIPLKCIFLNNQEITFGGETLEGCMRVIPSIDANGQMNPIGAALYLSPDVYKSNFAQFYLMNKESEYLKLAYSDEDTGMPLALYQGQVIGPLKIWEVSYPDDLIIPLKYYKNEIPDPELNRPRN